MFDVLPTFAAIPLVGVASIAVFIGFVGLIWSADRFVAGAASIASSFGIAPLIIGLTIVSFGTSAPEVMVSINASLKDAGDLAIGNALGSNIANIGLVLAITCLLAPIPVHKHVLQHEMPVLLAVSLLAGIFLFDGKITLIEGIILLATLVPSMFFLVRSKQKGASPEEIAEEETQVKHLGIPTAIFWFVVGLVALIISSDILVLGAKTLAEYFGISPLIIGLTVVAIGTSLPELAASAISALKGHHDIALGNIVGSNIFNLLAVMGVPGLLNPITMGADVFYRDYLVMMGITLTLVALISIALLRTQHGHARIGRSAGVLFLLSYLGYYAYLFQSA